MRIAGNQTPAPESLQVGMLQDALHQQFAQTSTAETIKHENVADIGVGRKVRDDAGKANLLLSPIHAKTKRILNRPLDGFSRNAFGPVTIREEAMNQGSIKAPLVGGDAEVSVSFGKRLRLTFCSALRGSRHEQVR